jgi:exosortase H (IPTLxxWG-CTERM-specific)
LGYRKEKKRKYKPQTGWSEKLKSRWRSRYPVLLFLGLFALLMGVFYIILLSQWFTVHINPYILSANANLSVMLLNLFGQQTQAFSETIFSQSFSISIARGCDAIEAMGLFSCALLAFPARWKAKVTGLIIGIVLLFVLNIIRIVSLFLAGVYYPSLFDMIHLEVWQVIFILIALVLWMIWLRYVALPGKPNEDAK